ncbi:MAG TPA: hypothetical protein VFM05_06515, partial [Candidatus Saccharimonadales bacterium]|nr:hypothetical protein [Candidatus Saccharimonadales bacterium]
LCLRHTVLLHILSNQAGQRDGAIRLACWASAIAATASDITAHKIDSAAAFFIKHPRFGRYLSRERKQRKALFTTEGFVEWEDQIWPEIRLNDARITVFALRASFGSPFYFVVANSGTAAGRGYQKSGALFMRHSSLFGILGPSP